MGLNVMEYLENPSSGGDEGKDAKYATDTKTPNRNEDKKRMGLKRNHLDKKINSNFKLKEQI